MTWRTTLALPLMLFFSGMYGCASVAPSLSSPSAEPVEMAFDESAAHRVLAESVAAWSAGDIERFMDAYAEDCLFIASSGLTRGKQAVLARYKERYPDPSAMGTLELEIVETRPAPPEGLTIAARWILAYPDRPASSGHTLIVMRHTAAGWRIVQDASM